MENRMVAAGHPLVDAIDGRIACVQSRALNVTLSETLADFLVWAEASRLRPMLLTRREATLSFAARYHLEAVGGVWAIETDDGFTDTRDGRVFSSFGDFERDSNWVPGVLPAVPPEVLHAVFSLTVHHPPTEDTRLGDIAELLAAKLTGQPLVAWGAHEPAMLHWSVEDFTASVRAGMPDESRRFIVGASGAFQAVSYVRRTRTGIEETVSGIAAIGPVNASRHELGAFAADALDAIAFHVSMPIVGAISVQPGRRDLTSAATIVAPAAPIAVLIGPRATRVMGLDFKNLAGKFEVKAAGRPRLPAAIVEFTGTETSTWMQAIEFAEAIGVDALARAVEGPSLRNEGD